jgi:hypothetical protein
VSLPIMRDLAAHGATVRLDRGKVLVRAGATPVPAELLERARAAKDDIRAILEQPVDEGADRQEERAAIIEYGAGVPRDWAEGFARLDPRRPPDDVPGKRWLQFVDDCGMFLDGGWAAKAAELGWGPLDLFGCDRERPFARVDHLGLLWLLKGGTVVELHRDQAVIRIADGARQTYRRRPVEFGRVVLAWELST